MLLSERQLLVMSSNLKEGKFQVMMDHLPELLPPGGISAPRKQYLLKKNIVQHCREEYRQEFAAVKLNNCRFTLPN